MARYTLLTEEEISKWLEIPVRTLETQRLRPPSRCRPIPYLKLPNGKIRYREDQVNEWIEEQSKIAANRPHRKTG